MENHQNKKGQIINISRFEDVLKNGVVLCQLINKIAGPNSVKKINERGSNFQLMENIKTSLGSSLGNGMDDNTWNQEVFYNIEMSIPAVIARNNNTEKVCNFIFKK